MPRIRLAGTPTLLDRYESERRLAHNYLGRLRAGRDLSESQRQLCQRYYPSSYYAAMSERPPQPTISSRLREEYRLVTLEEPVNFTQENPDTESPEEPKAAPTIENEKVNHTWQKVWGRFRLSNSLCIGFSADIAGHKHLDYSGHTELDGLLRHRFVEIVKDWTANRPVEECPHMEPPQDGSTPPSFLAIPSLGEPTVPPRITFDASTVTIGQWVPSTDSITTEIRR